MPLYQYRLNTSFLTEEACNLIYKDNTKRKDISEGRVSEGDQGL